MTSNYSEVNTDQSSDSEQNNGDENYGVPQPPVLRFKEFLSTTGGILMIINILLLLLPFFIYLYWVNMEENYWESFEVHSLTSFFLFATITPSLLIMFFLCLLKWRANNKLPIWSRLLTYHCLFWGTTVAIAAGLMTNEAWKLRCQAYHCNVLKYLASGTSIVASLMLFVEAYFHYSVYGKHVYNGRVPSKKQLYRGHR